VKHALVTKVEGFVDAVLHKPQANTNQPTSTPELTLPATTPMIATTSMTPQSTPPSSTPGTPTLAPKTPPATAALDLSQAFVITFDELKLEPPLILPQDCTPHWKSPTMDCCSR
jgi:hypothetical protein